MGHSSRLTSAVCLISCLFALSPSAALARTFIKLSGIKGEVADTRHAGWTDAVSWSPAMPPGQTCTSGWEDCLAHNGHRITILRRADGVSRALADARKAVTHIDEVKIEDFDSGGCADFSASTLTLKNVQIADITVTGEKGEAVEAVTLVFEKSSSEVTSDESAILGVLGAPRRR